MPPSGTVLLSIIIPTLNEEDVLPPLLRSLTELPETIETIVVDGGSVDRTAGVVRAFPDVQFIPADRGRGGQLRRGIKAASGEALLMLHADSTPSPAMLDFIRRFSDLPPEVRRRYAVTQFRLRFDRDSVVLRVSSFLARFDSIFTSFGDQGILVGRETYGRIGPLREIPLFEDVEFLRRARRLGRVRKSPHPITTSARRFCGIGPLRTQVLNLCFLLRWLLGSDPEVLARNYRRRSDVPSRRRKSLPTGPRAASPG